MSKVVPVRVRYSSFGSRMLMPFGSERTMTSEKTPWVDSPTRMVRPGRSMRACVKDSPALNVVPAVSTAMGPV